MVLHAARFERWREAAQGAIAAAGGEIVGNAGSGRGLSLLLALPGALDAPALRALLAEAGAAPASLAEVGSHAARFRVGDADSPSLP